MDNPIRLLGEDNQISLPTNLPTNLPRQVRNAYQENTFMTPKSISVTHQDYDVKEIDFPDIKGLKGELFDNID